MAGMNSDQLHRSTLGIYSSLMDQFNPSLQKLVSLGNSYIQAFQALALTSEAYFNALAKIGEQAFHTTTSRSIGDILIQISESQRRLTMELEGVFHRFSTEVLHEMDDNIRLDKDYISGSRRRYEMEVRSQATALERQLRRGANQDGSEYVHFLRESHDEALKEEERRYRFLAEKHCGLTQSIVSLMNKTGDALQQRANGWKEEVNATRGPEARQPTSLDNMVGMREEERWRGREEQPLGRVPSRAPSPRDATLCSSSVSESVGGGGGRTVRALVAHQPGASHPTLLPFGRGDTITLLVPQPRNGWLYGMADSSSRQGWFPAAYVEATDDTPRPTGSSGFGGGLRSSSSMNDLLDQPGGRNYRGAPPPPPPPPSSLSSKSEPHGSRPELFPKGTNPFATVKLKPHVDQ
ncbi:LOW QUALITY PROTEIN: BAR/IMD domain-containing adapter protein 2-like 2 [Centroberyx affinis]|uniref:LOW QUALITY PROTEIN: BAR/IMD domain-containing adapter protein 2-like 2 n=1 Tax=Centroberyx affinis TaxID=166261 RepID=UPI003A5C4D1F